MRRINSKGYYVIETDKGLELEHRHIYFKANPKDSRRLHIHHIDHCKTNNHIDNLIALPEYMHKLIHLEAKRLGKPLSREQIVEFCKTYKPTKVPLGASNTKRKRKKYKPTKARIYNWLKRHN